MSAYGERAPYSIVRTFVCFSGLSQDLALAALPEKQSVGELKRYKHSEARFTIKLLTKSTKKKDMYLRLAAPLVAII